MSNGDKNMRDIRVGKVGALAIGCVAAVASANGVNAATVAALQDGNRIVWIDIAKKKVTRSVALAGQARLVGFDVRPKDGMLYGVTASGAIVTVDAKTGKWQQRSQLSEALPKGAAITVDFNPVADRMRILSSTGLSLRVNVDDGKAIVDGSLKYAESDPSKGRTPNVTAGSYSNSFAGTKETTLYDIDASTGMLLRQVPPNDGVLASIGSLGIKLNGPVAFDIASNGQGGNVGWLVNGGRLYSVDIATGAAKSVGAIAGLKGRIGDIAVLPGM
jgi:outer membrane protein assembly factor BamB